MVPMLRCGLVRTYACLGIGGFFLGDGSGAMAGTPGGTDPPPAGSAGCQSGEGQRRAPSKKAFRAFRAAFGATAAAVASARKAGRNIQRSWLPAEWAVQPFTGVGSGASGP